MQARGRAAGLDEADEAAHKRAFNSTTECHTSDTHQLSSGMLDSPVSVFTKFIPYTPLMTWWRRCGCGHSTDTPCTFGLME